MEALILSGGYGTRLRPITLKTPKELLPIVSKPAIDYLLENLVRHGVTVVHFSVNDTFADLLRTHVGDGSRFGLKRVNFIVEHTGSDDKKLGAVGALEFIGTHLDGKDDYLIVGGDNFAPYFDFTEMEASHRASGCDITIGLHKLKQKELLPTLGVAEILPTGKILRFYEKVANPPTDLVSTAIYLVKPSFFKEIVPGYVAHRKARGEKPDNPGQLWEHLLANGHFLNGYVSTEFWMDIGKPQGYLLANEYVLGKKFGGKAIIDRDATVGSGLKTTGSIFIGVAKIGGNVTMETHVMVMDGAEIGDNVRLENCLIFPGARIGDGCSLKNCIVAEGAVVKPGMDVGEEHRVLPIA
jgi:mannose-1-phosphate guanylyltransferase